MVYMAFRVPFTRAWPTYTALTPLLRLALPFGLSLAVLQVLLNLDLWSLKSLWTGGGEVFRKVCTENRLNLISDTTDFRSEISSGLWGGMEYNKKLFEYYQTAAFALFNVCAILLVLNVALLVVFEIRDLYVSAKEVPFGNPLQKYGLSSVRRVYPDLDEESLKVLLNETWYRPFAYEPFTVFKEHHYRGRYVNVDVNGYRLTKNQGPWPPSPSKFNIFLFGGSTTFGYGLPDRQTIASYLQDILPSKRNRDVRIYNFGRGMYFSVQERVLLEKLLSAGFVPRLAIFIDGLNDFYLYDGQPKYTSALEKYIESGTARCELPIQLPMMRLAGFLRYQINKTFVRRLSDAAVSEDDLEKEILDFDERIYNNRSRISNVVNRYLENRKIIEAVTQAYGVQSVFVWQPVPTYKYDLRYHPFARRFGRHCYSRYGYQYMAELIKEKPLGRNFLWCADLQENAKEPLYVDELHYTAKMCEMFATAIANRCRSTYNGYPF
jgi:hypothetical protein